jgi:hypothetical protein
MIQVRTRLPKSDEDARTIRVDLEISLRDRPRSTSRRIPA